MICACLERGMDHQEQPREDDKQVKHLYETWNVQ